MDTPTLTLASEGNGAGNDRQGVFASASQLLADNWRGLHTVPAAGLYPHQWSWDSAFIAIGLRHLSPRRASQELESLFSAQWTDGRVPQIVFDPDRGADYSPGPGFWRSTDIPGGPSVPTSGLVQPPNHAWAALLVHRVDPGESERRGFLSRMYPRLVAWHDYLRTRRTRGPTALACLVHPWESGMDNAPAWDSTLAHVGDILRTAGEVSDIPRPDLAHAEVGERPTNNDYAQYLYLARRYRDHDCDDRDADFPFLVEDPAFNALWSISELALAAIAEIIGADPEPHRGRSADITSALHAVFDPELGLFVPRDVTAGRLLRHAGVSGLIPLLVSEPIYAARLFQTLNGPRFRLGAAVMVPSYDLTAPSFDPARYWKGPSWFSTTWLIMQGLRRLGRIEEANLLADQMINTGPRLHFPEYVNPIDATPHGTRHFSWTAALTLDAAATRHSDPMNGLP